MPPPSPLSLSRRQCRLICRQHRFVPPLQLPPPRLPPPTRQRRQRRRLCHRRGRKLAHLMREAITCNHGSSVVSVSWPRSRSGVAPTLMETEAVNVDEGRGRSAWDEAAGGRCLRTAAEGIVWGPLFVKPGAFEARSIHMYEAGSPMFYHRTSLCGSPIHSQCL